MFIYGGWGNNGTCTSDLWELRCTSDERGQEDYEWIYHNSATQPLDRMLHSASDFNKTAMYMWGGYRCLNSYWLGDYGFPLPEMWLYNVTSSSWRMVQSFDGFVTWTSPSVYYKKTNSIVVIFNQTTSSMKLVNGTFEVTLSRIQSKGSRDIITNTYSPSAVVVDDDILLYGQANYGGFDGDVSFWNLSFIDEQCGWLLLPNAISVNRPLALRGIPDNYVLAGQSLYVFGGDVAVPSSSIGYVHARNLVWQFDLISRTWWRTWSHFCPPSLTGAASAVIESSLIVLFGGVADPTTSIEDYGYPGKDYSVIWVYDTGIRRWMLYVIHRCGDDQPSDRVYSSLSDLGNGSLLLFGGLSSTLLNDFWRLDLNCKGEFRPVWTDCVMWYRLHDNHVTLTPSHYPTARHSHNTAVVDDFFFLFSGTQNLSGEVNPSDMFIYTISKQKWRRVQQSGVVRLASYSLRLPSAQVGNKTVVALPATQHEENTGIAQSGTLVFDLRSLTWTMMTNNTPFDALALFAWESRLILFGVGEDVEGHETNLFSFTNPSCVRGQSSFNWTEDECAVCRIGTYAELGYEECRICPTGLTTFANGSVSLSNCICPHDYCHHGTCYRDVTDDGTQLKAVCSCTFGYTGGSCNTLPII